MAVIDRYDIEARYMPALVSSVPFVLLSYYYLSALDNTFWTTILGLTVGSVGFTTAIFIVMVNFCRGFAKLIEEKIFNMGRSFPTTAFLLDDNTTLSDSMKKKIIDKILKNFDIDLRQNTANTESNHRVIHEAVGQIRRLFYKKNDLLLKRNIQYGFAKNLMSGSIIATFISLFAIVISHVSNNKSALLIATVLLIAYIILATLSFLLVRFTARHYAYTLYDEFVAF